MAKRFTETNKWDDPWFTGLGIKNQMFWIYLLDKCNHAGVWKVNWPLVQFHIKGFHYDPEVFKGRISEINPEKWFIPKFIQFQYGTLNPSNRAHASVISMLEKEGASKELASPYLGAKDKDKDKEQDKDKVKDKEVQVRPIPFDFEVIWNSYPKRIGRKEAERHFRASVKSDVDFKNIQLAIRNYLNCKQVKEGFIQNGSTWFNNWQDWTNYTEGKDGVNERKSIFDWSASKSGQARHFGSNPGLREAGPTARTILDGIRDNRLPETDREEKPKEPSGNHQPDG